MTAQERADRHLEHVRRRVAAIVSTLADIAEMSDRGLRELPAETTRLMLLTAENEMAEYVAALAAERAN
ncbi:hypothetical protein [Methylobacterium radiotolerans]|uniref:hypothetical protein n=1 Tax=Methylobacterium radiotolerans TaxID=31998 RepID=UPI0038D1FE0C